MARPPNHIVIHKETSIEMNIEEKISNFDHIEELFLPIQKLLIQRFTVTLAMNSAFLKQIQLWRDYNMV